MAKRWLHSVDVQVDDASGALLIRSGLEGAGKPDLLTWITGTDAWAGPDAGSVSHDGTVVFIRVGSGGALVSIDDAVGQEKPYIVPPNYWREIVVPGGIPTGARLVAKNLDAGVNFSDLAVEVR
jgi:hypothetical protein